MKRQRSTCLFNIIFILVAGGLVACSNARSDHSSPPAASEIRIGVIAYLHGEYRELSGRPTMNAATLAVDPINQAGGLLVGEQRFPITLVVKEIDSSAEQAVTAVRQLINQENVNVIVGPQFSNDAIPAGSLAEAAQVPMICPIATNPQVTAGRQYVFRMSFADDVQGSAIAKFAYQDLGLRRAGVLYDVADAYTRGVAEMFRQSFEAEGGKVVAFEGYTTGMADFIPFLTRIQQQDVDLLFLPNYSNDALRQGQQARQIGLNVPLLGGDGWDQRILAVVPEFEGAFMTAHWASDMQNARTQEFGRTYRAVFGQEPNDTAALTYDAFMLLFQSIQVQGRFDSVSIRDGLLALGPYEGVTGVIDFQSNGDPVKSVVILHFAGGKYSFYKLIMP